MLRSIISLERATGPIFAETLSVLLSVRYVRALPPPLAELRRAGRGTRFSLHQSGRMAAACQAGWMDRGRAYIQARLVAGVTR